eukprot:5827404-Amphidinium_carterae.1
MWGIASLAGDAVEKGCKDLRCLTRQGAVDWLQDVLQPNGMKIKTPLTEFPSGHTVATKMRKKWKMFPPPKKMRKKGREN